MAIDPDEVDWDEANREHATRHGVTVDEITHALLNAPTVRRNRKGRPGDYYAFGVTDGGRRIVVVVTWDPSRRVVRPDHIMGAAMNDKQPDEMTEAELADFYYAHRDDPEMAGEQVEYVPPRSARVAVRLSLAEERQIRHAAQQAGMSVSAFLRQVGLSAAGAGVVDIDRLRRDVDEARARIDDAWQALG